MKDRYEKMQTYIFSLIPEKWDEIYLYASIVDEKNSNNKGELFFYYLPKGLLKKKPINVYEVPNRFNINEEKYLKIVEELYICIKDLAQDFKNLSSRALMVIGKTELTESLYKPYIKKEYSKTYAVNIRNRFKSESMHLIITNFDK